ncbi:hypothetical protein NKR23_g350 [Pleurostoma richardsiae]|uniref:DUF8021 domain-containing protein n=1 Tax=Pleurostoma richardsiae TaxID=41990 RepID=A0AA38S2G4_9PEZI|nr:hypothetical protein NKR23_g350 [Pleurostoma richardsiae]
MLSHPLLLSISLVCVFASLTAARCQWSVLQDATDTYIYSQSTGKLEGIFTNSSVKYLENNRETDINKGVLSKPLVVDHTRTTFDQDACATYTELIVTDANDPHVIGTQIRYESSGENLSGINALSVDSVVTTTGDWLFNASQTLAHVLKEDWGTIDLSKRDTREALKAAADSYLDLWGNSSSAVPWGTPCDRLEGSAYTGTGLTKDSCNVGIPSGQQPPNTDRRYVIDDTVGSVSVLCKFGSMRDAPDSHEFRLEGGKLRYVHTMTVMRSL